MFGAFGDGHLFAFGGFHQCSYSDDLHVGRLRHIYVAIEHRNNGVAGALISQILAVAAKNFKIVRLRTNNPVAIALYVKNGFVGSADLNASHEIRI